MTVVDSYLDTSFIMKFYVVEPESSACISWLEQNRQRALISPLTDVEVIASLMRVFPGKASAALSLVSNYRDDCAAGVFRKVNLDDEVFRQAERMAELHTASLNLKSLDLLHLATTIRYGISALGTFDKRLRDAATALGLTVFPA